MTITDTAGLLFMANLGCIEFHPLHSRCEDVEHPDYLFFDLDPFEPYTYEDVLSVARHIKVLLDGLGMVAFPKTSGATGLQIFVPSGARRVHLRAGARVRWGVRPPDPQCRPRPRHDGLARGRSRREGLHRPQYESLRREHRRGVLAPAGAAGSRVDAAHMGGGPRGRVPSRSISASTTSGRGSRGSATCSRGWRPRPTTCRRRSRRWASWSRRIRANVRCRKRPPPRATRGEARPRSRRRRRILRSSSTCDAARSVPTARPSRRPATPPRPGATPS